MPSDRRTAEELLLAATGGNELVELYRRASERTKPVVAMITHAASHRCNGLDALELDRRLDEHPSDDQLASFVALLNEHDVRSCWKARVDAVEASLRWS